MTFNLTLAAIPSSVYIHKLEFIEQASQQLVKDFNLIGVTLTFSGNGATAYTELYNQLLPIVINLSANDHPKLLQLLYRIDINEQLIAAEIKKEINQLPLENILTRLIIYRELQKVVLRDYFKKGGTF